ncbi:MAG: hypothetical protein L0215_01585 [Gemmataceae bacterium]|nr:hypothetical protein [Gemmataceae bacterium]
MQPHLHARAFVHFAVDVDFAAEAFDDLFDDGEALAAAALFSRKEGLENARQGVVVDAVAAVLEAGRAWRPVLQREAHPARAFGAVGGTP